MTRNRSSIVVRILGDAKKLNDELGIASKAIGAFGIAAAAALTKGFVDSLGAEANDDLIASRLGLDEATAGRLGDVAAGAYRDAWGDSLADVTGTVTALFSSFEGLDDGRLEALTGQAEALGTAFEIDVGQGVQTASELVEAGLVDSADEAFDLLTRGLQEMPQGIRDELLAASNEYGDFFADLGFSGDEAFAALTEYADDGIFGIDKFGDALKELTIRGSDMSTASVEAYEAAGLSAEEMSAAFLEGGDVARDALDSTIDGLLSIEDPVEQSNAAIALFGTPLEDLSVSEIPDFLEGLENMGGGLGDVEGAAQAMADQLGSNGLTKIEAFKRRGLGRLAVFVENRAIPAIESLGGFVEDLGDFFNNNRFVIVGALAGITAGVAAWAVSAAAAAIANFTFAGSLLAAAAPFIAIGLAIAALVAGLVWAYENVEWFREGVDAAFAFIQDEVVPVVMAIVDGIIKIFGGWVDFFAGIFTGDWSRVWEGITGILGGQLDIIKALLGAAWDVIKGAASGAWDSVKSTATGAVDSVVESVKGMPGRIAGFVTDIAGAGLDAGKAFLEGMLDGIGALGAGLANAVTEVGRAIANTIVIDPMNDLISLINALEFDLPKISTPLGSIGGGTVGLPNIGFLDRFHDGGAIGRLGGARREVPILAESGEFVLSRDDVDRILRGGRGGVTVNVTNPLPTHADIEDGIALGLAVSPL